MPDAASSDRLSKSSAATRKSAWDFLFAPVDIAFLVYFRIAFGCIILANVGYYFIANFVEANYVSPPFHFTYLGFEWVRPWPGIGTWLHFIAIGLLAICMAVGFFYRISAVLFAIGFTHLFLIDKALYQNHYYLLCLMSWIMVLMPAHRACSLDAIQYPAIRSATVPAWTLWLLRFQIAVPYFYGGIAKFDRDWLAGAPLRPFLADNKSFPLIGQFFTEEWCVQFFVYGGLWFDLLIVPGLLWRRTRVIAYGFALAFHLMNHSLFHIGIFPWFMIFASLLFFPPDWPRKLLRLRPAAAAPPHRGLSWSTLAASKKAGVLVLGTYVAFQLLWPLRHYTYPDNPNWTERGHCFAWHMLLRGKRAGVRFHVTDPETGWSGDVNLRLHLTATQLKRMSRSPDMILDFTHFVANEYSKLGYNNAEIRVRLLVSLNGRKPQLLVDSNVNLAAQPRTYRRPDWIVPLTEPLPDEPWDVPLPEWEQRLGLPPFPPETGDGRTTPKDAPQTGQRPPNQIEFLKGVDG
jgi:hypothetical protein